MTDSFDDRHHGLPPELQVAPREFDAWSQDQLRKEQDESIPTLSLYHYTDETATKGILTHEKIWCFNHQHQKDRTEFDYSLQIARRVITDIGKSTDGPTHYFCASLLDVLDNNSFTAAFEFYLFSLSRHEDDPKQWRDYGDKGRGFAIGFAPALFAPNEMTLHEQANENLHVGRVIYGDADTEARHRRVIEAAAEITSRVAWANRSLGSNVKPSDYFIAMVREVIASQLIWNCLTAKHQDFANEREVRFIVMNVIKRFDGLRKRINGKTYIEASLPLRRPGSVMQILVGPVAPSDAEQRVSNFLRDQGYPEGIPVRRSSAILDAGCPAAERAPPPPPLDRG
jgi:Protein of unknown function (DUF2971)